MRTFPRLLSQTLALIATLSVGISCQKPTGAPTAASDQSNVARIDGVTEPPELLIPGEKPHPVTGEAKAFGKVLEGIKAGHEAAGLPALDAFISAHSRVEEAYTTRATLRCASGNLTGARTDVEAALSGIPHMLPPEADEHDDLNELLAMHAKLAFMAHDDPTVSRDIHQIITSYSDDIQYLNDGRVKVAEKPNTPCGWTSEEVAEWLKRNDNSPDAQVFRAIFVASFAMYSDDIAKALTQRYTTELMEANPSFAPAYFYSAVAIKQANFFKVLGDHEAERAVFYRQMIDLWTKALQLNPSIERAYAARADENLQLKNYSDAVNDFDHAIALAPDKSALWNDRALAKQETYDKSGAVTDFTQAIALDRQRNDFPGMAISLDQQGDLYIKLDDYKHALDDDTALIAARLHNVLVFINLDFIRELYPVYAKVDDVTLKNKIHKMFVPNYTEDNFERTISNPAGMHPSMDGELPEAYLKRADVLLALKRFDDARRDYERAELFKERQEGDRWRTPPNFSGMSLDVKTLETENPLQLKAWVKPPEDDKTPDPEPTRFTINCKAHTAQMGQRPAFEPNPGTYAEAVSDFFCSSRP